MSRNSIPGDVTRHVPITGERYTWNGIVCITEEKNILEGMRDVLITPLQNDLRRCLKYNVHDYAGVILAWTCTLNINRSFIHLRKYAYDDLL